MRLAWVLAVPTVPVSDFAMYRESANYLSEFGHLDPGFIYMPGFVALLAWVKDAGRRICWRRRCSASASAGWAPPVCSPSRYGLIDDGERRGSAGGAAAGDVSAPARTR